MSRQNITSFTPAKLRPIMAVTAFQYFSLLSRRKSSPRIAEPKMVRRISGLMAW